MADLFRRILNRPVLAAQQMPTQAAAVLNPGAAEMGGEVILLVRVEDRTGCSSIHTARSRNGVDGWEVEAAPLLQYGRPEHPYEAWGCEDARVTWLQDQGAWYVTYTAASPMGPAVALARTIDFRQIERLGLILAPTNKDAVLLSQRCRGRYAMLHRPEFGELEHIWSAYSGDLRHWGEPHCVLEENDGPRWDAIKVGSGPPPLLTEHGWMLIYHGAKYYGGRLVYRVGLALLDRDHPEKLLIRAPGWVFQAEAAFELEGFVPGIIFPTGLLRRGDELWMYYGAADTSIGLAVAEYQCVLDHLLRD